MIRPFIPAGCAFFLSLFLFSYCGMNAAAAVFGVAAVLTVLFFFLRKKQKIIPWLLVICVSLMGSSLSYAVKTVSDYMPAISLCSETPRSVSGTLSEAETAYGKYHYTLEHITVDGVSVRAKIRISYRYQVSAEIGDTMTFPDATIYELGSTPQTAMNYKANGIYIGAYTNADCSVTPATVRPPAYYLDLLRRTITKTLHLFMPDDYAAVSDAILTGNQSDLSADTLLNFRYAGVSHLFAVSGFHLSLWTGLLQYALLRLFRKNQKFAPILSMLFVLFFMALTGFTKSVTRAGIMLIIALFGQLIAHRADSLNSLFIALTVILLYNPFAVMSVALQMSFLATFGLITVAPPLSESMKTLRKKCRSQAIGKILTFLLTTVVFSLVAAIFTMPVSVCRFGYYSVISPLSNVLCMIPGQLLMVLSGFGVLFAWLTPLAKPLFLFSSLLVRYLIFITDKLSHLPYAIIDASDTVSAVFSLFFLTVILILIFFFRKNNKQLRRITAASVAVFFAFSTVSAVTDAYTVKVSVADVGNGTSIVFSCGNTDILIGCGGKRGKDYRLTAVGDKIASRTFDLWLLPRKTSTESAYAYELLGRYDYENMLMTTEDFPVYLADRLPEGILRTDRCTVKLDDTITLTYENSDAFSGARLLCRDFSCVILFRSTSDFSAVSEEWQSADLLITRQSLPQTDLSRFGTILISGDEPVIYDNSNIHSTFAGGQLTYRMSPVFHASVQEEKHDYS